MESNTLRNGVREIVAINRANNRSKMFHKNRSMDEELPQLKRQKKPRPRHLGLGLADFKEKRAKVKLRAELIQAIPVVEQTVPFGFRSETFTAPSNLEMHDAIEIFFAKIKTA